MRFLPGLVVVLEVGCGSVSSNQSDAQVDTSPGAGSDGPAMPEGMHRHYVVDHQFLAVTPAQVTMYALDLDGDGQPDNRLGMGGLAVSTFGIDRQGNTSAAVDRGDVLLLLDVQATDLMNASNAGVNFYIGSNPSPAPCVSASDSICRRHLAGNGSFMIASGQPHVPAMLGAISNGEYITASGGNLRIQIAPTGTAIELDLIGARAKITGITENAVATGILGGAVTKSDVENKLSPAIVAAYNAIIKRDCTSPTPPGCGCAAGTNGAVLIATFDGAQPSCRIELDEYTGNTDVQKAIAPDVMVDGQLAVSIGLGFTAVHGDFTP